MSSASSFSLGSRPHPSPRLPGLLMLPERWGWRQGIQGRPLLFGWAFLGACLLVSENICALEHCLYEQPQMIYTSLTFSSLISYTVYYSTLFLQMNSCPKFLSQALFQGNQEMSSLALSLFTHCFFFFFFKIHFLSSAPPLRIMQVPLGKHYYSFSFSEKHSSSNMLSE